jgi:hypothetical protein
VLADECAGEHLGNQLKAVNDVLGPRPCFSDRCKAQRADEPPVNQERKRNPRFGAVVSQGFPFDGVGHFVNR